MHTHVYTHIDMRTSQMHELTYIKCTWINTCIYRYRRTYIHPNKHTYIRPSVSPSARTFIHTHIYTYTHTYIYTHIDLLKTRVHKITKSKAINQTRQINFRETYVPKYVLQQPLFLKKWKVTIKGTDNSPNMTQN